MRRSSSVRPFGSFHSAMSRDHVHFLRHPVVGAGGEVLLPGPLVLERHQLVDVGLAVDDALVGGLDAARGRRCAVQRPQRAAGAVRADGSTLRHARSDGEAATARCAELRRERCGALLSSSQASIEYFLCLELS